MKFTLFTILGFASLALSAPATLETRETAIEATNRLMYSVTISQFIAARNARNPSFVNWESNGCSYSPDNPFGFNFVNSCHRHDFGYRNFKDQNRFTDANKGAIDNKFKADMYAQCETEGGAFVVGACKGVANVYYTAVKELGSKRAVEIEGDFAGKFEDFEIAV